MAQAEAIASHLTDVRWLVDDQTYFGMFIQSIMVRAKWLSSFFVLNIQLEVVNY